MKTKILIILCAILSSIDGLAQTKNHGAFVEATAAYGHEYYRYSNRSDYDSKYAIILPRVGYKFNKDLSAGVMFSFDTSDYGFCGYGVFVQYDFVKLNRFNAFSEFQADYNLSNDDMDAVLPGSSHGSAREHYYEAGLTLGATYALSRHVNVVARCLYLGYSSKPGNFEQALGDGYFKLSAESCRMQLGIQVVF